MTQLVSKEFASVHTARETVIATAANHLNSCHINDSAAFDNLRTFLNEALQAVQDNFNTQSSSPDPWTEDFSTAKETSAGSYTLATSLSKRSTFNSETTADRNDVRSLVELTQSKTNPDLPCFAVPYDRNALFWGRTSTLKDIAAVLCPRAGEHLQSTERSESSERPKSSERLNSSEHQNGSRIASYALSGTGGIGKSQVALQFAHDYRDKFDAIFWVPADETEKMLQTFAYIAVKLKLVHEGSVESKARLLTRDLVLGWLSRPVKSYQDSETEATWLMIFDNVESPDKLADFWPHNATGSVLVTSRDPLVESHFYSITQGNSLPAFDDKESENFLLRLTRRQGDTKDKALAHRVAKILGGVPLAIVQLAGLIARKDISFQEFINDYGNEDQLQEMLNHHMVPMRAAGYLHTLSSVWKFESLEHGAGLLDVLSFLDPDGIPEYMLRPEKIRLDVKDFSNKTKNFEKARTELIKSSLITRNRSDQKLVIHRMIQDAARARMNSDRYSSVFTTALQLIAAAWPYEDDSAFRNETYKRGDDHWTRTNELYSHILVLRKHSRAQKQQPPTDFTPEHLEPPKVLLKAAW